MHHLVLHFIYFIGDSISSVSIELMMQDLKSWLHLRVDLRGSEPLLLNQQVSDNVGQLSLMRR